MTDDKKAQHHLTCCDALFGRMQSWTGNWQRILDFCTPHKAYVNQQSAPGTPPVSLANISRIHDTTGIEGLNTLADSHVTSIFPPGSVWFKWMPPSQFKDSEEIKKWYANCSARMLDHLAKTNFYTEMFSTCRDRSGPGTGGMFIDRGKDSIVSFKYMALGTYAIEDDQDGNVRTVYRKFKLTCMQAVEKFMEYKEGDPPSVEQIKAKLGEQIANCYKAAMEGDANKMAEEHEFVHGVKPRIKRNPKMIDALNMKYESVYIVVKDKKLAEEGGFETFPFLITRFEKWGIEPYGYSPAYNAMPNILTANYLVKLLKAIGEVKAMPRLLELGGQKRNVDLRAGGRTVVSKEEAAAGMPREWASAGDFELGQWLIEQERATIRRFFFTDLFKMFSSLPTNVLKDMTAEVARGLKSENLQLLAPSFTQFVTDFRTGMERLFAIGMESGLFDEPPDELKQATAEDGFAMIPDPDTSYISRFGLALKELEDQAADQTIRAAGEAARLYPGVLDNIDFDKWIREKAETLGVNPDILKELDEIKEVREQRAAAAQQAESMAMAQAGAEAVKNASQANPQNLQALAQAS